MATATSRQPAAKKAAAKKAPARKAAAKKSSLPSAARDIEKAVTDELHREVKRAKKLLETAEKDVRSIVNRFEKWADELGGKKSPAKKSPAKKTTAKKTPARKAPVRKAPARR